MAQPWRWERDQQFATTAYAEYDDGVGGRSLQDEEEEEEDLSLIICEIPTAGCKNGMYNVKKCKCECIPPYCPYDLEGGDCVLPSASCGGNPWTNCKRGLDCPWWINPLKAESCTTGQEVPPDTWNVYNHEKACCNINFPFSEVCGRSTIPVTDAPTKYPTVQAPEDDDFEIVPLKFDLGNLPQDLSTRALKDEMKVVLKRILVRLSERVPQLKISRIEEKVPDQMQLRERILRGKMITIYYNVYVIRREGMKYGPIIIAEIKSRYDEVKDQLRQFSDVNFLEGGIDFNLCTSESGDFKVCAKDITVSPTPPRPSPRPRPAPGVVGLPEGEVGISGINGRDGLAAWAIALIALVSVTALLCFVYLAFLGLKAVFIDGDKDTKVFVSDKSTSGRSGRTRSSGRTKSSRSRRTKSRDGGSRMLAIMPEASLDFTINTRTTRDRTMYLEDFTINTRTTRDRTMYLEGPSVASRGTRVGRDPPMYMPGTSAGSRRTTSGRSRSRGRRPDPVPDTMLITDGGHYSPYTRRYGEDDDDLPSRQSSRQRREPTMYINGASLGTRSVGTRSKSRDPTMYMEGGQGSRREPNMYDDDDQTPLYLEAAPHDDEPSYATTEPGQGADPTIYCYGDGADTKSGITMPTELDDGEAYHISHTRDSSYFADSSQGRDGDSFRTQEPGAHDGSQVNSAFSSKFSGESDFSSKISGKSGRKSRKRNERRYMDGPC